MLDAILLSRIQFAFTVTFHIIWPTFTIGMGALLLLLEVLWLVKSDKVYLSLYKQWVKIFALAFAVGVVTGVPLAYEFGTNFSNLSKIAGPILGPLFAVEVMTAFFLEAAFIGVMVFGWQRVPPKMHLLSTFIVVLGMHHSTFWITAANSWLQTPAGFEIANGVMQATNWQEIIFNPSMVVRMPHMLLASYITATVVFMSVNSYYLFKGRHLNQARCAFSISLKILTVLVPLQIIMGDLHGLNTLQNQPLKIAAMEGLWEDTRGADLVLFAIPDQEQEKNNYEIKIPKLTSFILTHDFNGEVKGLKSWNVDERPKVLLVFFAFRIMVGIGFLLLGTILISLYFRFKGNLFYARKFHGFCVMLLPLGFVATISGWFVTELGRQPWTIYNYLLTKDAVSNVLPEVVLGSLILFIIVYGFLAMSFLVFSYYLIQKGPLALEAAELKIKLSTDEKWLSVACHTSHVANTDDEKSWMQVVNNKEK